MHLKKAKSILSPQNGMNLCRGCVHGCIYCDSRSSCYNFGHDFEDVQIKINAPELLEDKLRRKRSRCVISTGAMSDPYIPVKESLAVTRACLEVIERHGFGLAIQTKSSLILRDIELLAAINRKAKCVVQMTLTTFDEELCKIVEPCVQTSSERFETLKVFRERGIPTAVWLGPLLPFINDTTENLNGILGYCVEAGVSAIVYFGMGMTLREGSREYFYEKLDAHFPGLRARYEKKYGNSYIVGSDNGRELEKLLFKTCADNNIICGSSNVFEFISALPAACLNGGQGELF